MKLFNVKCVMFNVILLYTLHFTHYTAFAQSLSSADLINYAKEYDGKTVVYEGEVIGDIMVRGEYAWINVNDGKGAIGVWVDKDLAKDIQYSGSYKSTGDWIEVTGVFYRSCPQHGGDLDIHAVSLRKIKSGWLREQKSMPAKSNLLIIFGIVLFLSLILRFLRTR